MLEYSSDKITLFFKKKKNSTKNYFELLDINCRYHFFVKSLNHYELLVNQ